MPGQAVVDEHEIRMHQRAYWQVVAHHGGDEGECLALHRVDQIFVQTVFGVQADVGILAPQMAQVEPVVREALHELLELAAGDQALGFAAEHAGVVERLIACAPRQFGVRPAVSEEVREPLGDRKVILRLMQIEEQSRAEEGLIPGEHRFGERLVLVQPGKHELLELMHRFFRNRAARGVLHEPSQQVARLFLWLRGRGRNAKVAEDRAMALRWPRSGRNRPLDLNPLKCDARLATRRKRRIAVAAGQGGNGVHLRYRQSEQSVFNGLPRVQQCRGLVNARLWLNLEDATGGLHILGNVVVSGPPRTKRHGHGLVRGGNHEAGMLQHGARLNSYAIFARILGGEATRERPVGPAR